MDSYEQIIVYMRKIKLEVVVLIKTKKQKVEKKASLICQRISWEELNKQALNF